MATRKRKPIPTFGPEDVDPDAPKLFIERAGDVWQLRSEKGVLETYPDRSRAAKRALGISKKRFHEIFFESLSGKYLHLAGQDEASRLMMKIWRMANEDFVAQGGRLAG